MPKPPPTSPTSTRTLSCAMPSTSSHNVSRSPVGVWLLARSVMRPLAASKLASNARGSMGQGASRWLTRSSATTCAACAKAFAVAATSPWRISAATLPVASGPHLRRAGRGGRRRIDHARQRVVAHVDRLQRVPGLLARVRHDRRHGLADEAHGIDCERMPRRRRRRRATGPPEVRGRRQRLHAGAHEVPARHDGDDPGHRGRGRRVDADDPRVRIAASAGTGHGPAHRYCGRRRIGLSP